MNINLKNIKIISKPKKDPIKNKMTLETYYDGTDIYLLNKEHGYIFDYEDFSQIDKIIKPIGKLNDTCIEWYQG